MWAVFSCPRSATKDTLQLSEEAPLRIEIFQDPLFTEVFRTLHIKIKLVSAERDPDHPTRPKLLWKGAISGTHVMSGWVRVTPDNHIRWHFVSWLISRLSRWEPLLTKMSLYRCLASQVNPCGGTFNASIL